MRVSLLLYLCSTGVDRYHSSPSPILCPGAMRHLCLWSRVFLSLCIIFLSLTTLPYDNPVRLSFRFNFNILSSFALPPSPVSDDLWLFRSRAAFPLNTPSDDIAVIVKSGYGTRDRIAAWLEAHKDMHLSNLLVVADLSTKFLGSHYRYDDREMPVYNMIAWMLERRVLPLRSSRHPRLRKYSRLVNAITSGRTDVAQDLCRSFGWELDAMKVINPVGCRRAR